MIQLNQIIQQEGLGASLIRPRRDYQAQQPEVAGSRSSPNAGTDATCPPEAGETIIEDGSSGARPVPLRHMEVDRLAAELESTLSLAFVPAAVRRKGARPDKAKATGQAVAE